MRTRKNFQIGMLGLAVALILFSLPQYNVNSNAILLPARLLAYPRRIEVRAGRTANFIVVAEGNFERPLNLSVTLPFNSSWRADPSTVYAGKSSAISITVPSEAMGNYTVLVHGENEEAAANATILLTISSRISLDATFAPHVLKTSETSSLTIHVSSTALPVNVVLLALPSAQTIHNSFFNSSTEITIFPMSNVTHILVILKVTDYVDFVGVVTVSPFLGPTIVTVTRMSIATVSTTWLRTTTVTQTTQMPMPNLSRDIVLFASGWIIPCIVLLLYAFRTRRSAILRPQVLEKGALEKVQSERTCNVCGRKITTDFCPFCGSQPTSHSEASSSSKCFMCGREIATQFCPYCGTKQ